MHSTATNERTTYGMHSTATRSSKGAREERGPKEGGREERQVKERRREQRRAKKNNEGEKNKEAPPPLPDPVLELVKVYRAYNPHMTTYYYVQSLEENPNACVLCIFGHDWYKVERLTLTTVIVCFISGSVAPNNIMDFVVLADSIGHWKQLFISNIK
ncbi:hypothetical protein JHK82_048387 [Glycine max]|nr:hypothetical protein JHK82_048387 [Glycine max]